MGDHHTNGEGLKADVDSILAQAKEIAVQWGRISEANGVEMYAPRKEPQLFFGDRKAAEWDDDVLPALRKIYRGDLVQGAYQLYH